MNNKIIVAIYAILAILVISIGVSAEEQPDLVIQELTITPTTTQENQDVTIKVLIENQGYANTNLPFTLYFYDNDEAIASMSYFPL